jgi:hypothetical protein
MPENKLTSHLTQNTSLVSAINSWEMFLADQGRSPNTIKAFLSDVRLLTTFLPDGRGGRQDHHQGPQPLLRVDGKGARRAVQPQDAGAAHHLGQVAVPLAAPVRRPDGRPRRQGRAALRHQSAPHRADAQGIRRGPAGRRPSPPRDKPDARLYALVYLLLRQASRRAKRWDSCSSTSNWTPPTDRRSSSNIRPRRIVTRRENWPCPRTGSPPTRNTSPSTSEAVLRTTRRRNCSPGRRGGWSTCSKTSATKPG